jgi:hypothetical protein
MLIEPAALPQDERGLTTLRVLLPEYLVSEAEAEFASGDCQPVESAVCFGATLLLMQDVVENAPLTELLGLVGSYLGAVAQLQFQAWKLLQDRQTLNFQLAAARAEHAWREQSRRHEATLTDGGA